MLVLIEFGAKHCDALREPNGLRASKHVREFFFSGALCDDLAELLAGERAASINAEVEGAQVCGKRVHARRPLGRHVPARGQQYPQRGPRPVEGARNM